MKESIPFRGVPPDERRTSHSAGYPTPSGLLQDLFLEQVRKCPDQLAVITPALRLTYQELYTRANQLGHVLRGLTVKPITPVAVVMDKGWEQVVAVLGILQAGGAYLPLSPDLAQERLWYLLENAGVNLVLTQSWLLKKLEWPISTPCIPIDVYEPNEVSTLPLPPLQKDEDPAYMLYASPLTGLPKGEKTSHQEAAGMIAELSRRVSLRSNDRVFALSSLTTNLSVYAIFGTLAAGATIVLPGPDNLDTHSHWEDLVRQEQVTVWTSAPAKLYLFAEFIRKQGNALPEGLRHILLNGDWIPLQLPEQLKSLAKNIPVIYLAGDPAGTIVN